MSGIGNFGLNYYAITLFQCIANSSEVEDSLSNHNGMKTIPG